MGLNDQSNLGTQGSDFEDFETNIDPTETLKSIQTTEQLVANLEELYNEIIVADKVCQTTAEDIIEIDKNFADRLAVESFTKTPSQINLVFTKKYLTTAISTENSKISVLYSSVLLKLVEDAVKCLDNLDSEKTTGILDVMSDIEFTARNVLSSASENKETILPSGGGSDTKFLNILTEDLSALDVLRINTRKLGDLEELSAELKTAIVIVESSVYFKTLVHSAADGKEITLSTNSADHATYMNQSLTVLTLARFFNSDGMRQFNDELNSKVSSIKNSLIELTGDNDVSQLLQTKTGLFEVQNLMLYINSGLRLAAVSKSVFDRVLNLK